MDPIALCKNNQCFYLASYELTGSSYARLMDDQASMFIDLPKVKCASSADLTIIYVNMIRLGRRAVYSTK
jgi:hypothetical protein